MTACINTTQTTEYFQYSVSDSSRVYNISPVDGYVIIDTVYIYNEGGDLAYQLPYSKELEDVGEAPEYLNSIKGYLQSDTIYGDFNGDGVRESAWVESEYAMSEQTGREKDGRGILKFSNRSIPTLSIDYGTKWQLKNEGELNATGGDEIGVLPGGGNSACRAYRVYTLKNKKWLETCEPIVNSLNMRQAGIILIEKDTTKQGYAIVRSSFENSPLCSCQGCRVIEQSVKLN